MADELDPRARALLAAYRRDAGPSPVATERLLASLRRSAAQDEAQVLPLRPRAYSRHWVGVAVVGLVAAAVAIAIRVAPQRLDAGSQAAGSAAALHAGDEVTGGSVRAKPRAEVKETATTSTIAAEPEPESEPQPALQRPRAPGKREPAAAGVGARTPDDDAPLDADALAQELAMIRAVNDALATGAAEQALARLDEHRRRFPAGALLEEAAALQAVALCAAGRGAAGTDAAAAFLSAHPGSLSAERVRRACAVR